MMKNAVTYETLRYFAYSNDDIIAGNIRGIVLQFNGLGNQEMIGEHTERGRALAEKGIALLIPYADPWNWMNRETVLFTDALLDALTEHCGLPEDIPVAATGGSMGGQCALVYTRYAKRTPVACVVNCPVCDLPFHYTERPDLPRTLLSAFSASGEETLQQAMEARSPLHLAGSMPDVRYAVFHCDADSAVNIRAHSDRFVEAMKESHRIEYYVVPGRDHCDLDPASRALYEKIAEEAVLGAAH